MVLSGSKLHSVALKLLRLFRALITSRVPGVILFVYHLDAFDNGTFMVPTQVSGVAYKPLQGFGRGLISQNNASPPRCLKFHDVFAAEQGRAVLNVSSVKPFVQPDAIWIVSALDMVFNYQLPSPSFRSQFCPSFASSHLFVTDFCQDFRKQSPGPGPFSKL